MDEELNGDHPPATTTPETTEAGGLPHGESVQDALRRYAGALRRLLAKEEPVTLVVLHELALRYITIAAATGSPPHPGTALKNAVPYLFDGRAVRRAADSLDAWILSASAR